MRDELKSVEDVGSYYDEVTSIYLQIDYLVMQSGFFSADREKHIAVCYSRMNPPRGARLLDAGCGLGTMAIGFCRLDPELRITAITNGRRQVEAAVRMARDAGVGDRILVHFGSFTATGLPDARFDAAMAYESLGYAPYGEGFRELFRVLRPGGLAFVADVCAVDDPDILAIDALRYLRRDWFYAFAPVEEILSEATSAGFEVAAAHRNINALLDGSRWGGFVNSALGNFHRLPERLPLKHAEFRLLKPGPLRSGGTGTHV